MQYAQRNDPLVLAMDWETNSKATRPMQPGAQEPESEAMTRIV